MLLFVCSCFMDFVVVFVEAWSSLLFRDAVVCLFLFYGLCCCVCRGLVVIAVSRCCCLFFVVLWTLLLCL